MLGSILLKAYMGKDESLLVLHAALAQGRSSLAGIASRDGNPFLARYQKCSPSSRAQVESKLAVLAALQVAPCKEWLSITINMGAQQIALAANSSSSIPWDCHTLLFDIRNLSTLLIIAALDGFPEKTTCQLMVSHVFCRGRLYCLFCISSF